MSKAKTVIKGLEDLLGTGARGASREQLTDALRKTLAKRKEAIVRRTQDNAVKQIVEGTAPTSGNVQKMGKIFNPMPRADELMNREGAAILSAYNSSDQLAPILGREAADITDDEVRAWNKNRTNELMADLRARGLNFSPSYGIYGGSPEASFVVHGGQNMSPSVDEWLMSLGDKYQQEAIINPKGMVATRGFGDSTQPEMVPFTGAPPQMYTIADRPTDYFSDVYGDGFALDFDWGNKIPVSLQNLFKK